MVGMAGAPDRGSARDRTLTENARLGMANKADSLVVHGGSLRRARGRTFSASRPRFSAVIIGQVLRKSQEPREASA